jgi:hypothetical protein
VPFLGLVRFFASAASWLPSGLLSLAIDLRPSRLLALLRTPRSSSARFNSG